MTITVDRIAFRYSGGSANTSPGASLGGAMSTVTAGIISSGSLNNLFDDVSAAEALSGNVDYRGLYIANAHATDTWKTVVVYIDGPTFSSGTELAIGLAVEAVGQSMATIADESTAPSGVTFASPIYKKDALAVGDIAAGSFKGVWIRRTVVAGADTTQDLGSIRCEGNTA